jgi:hypothetical protein
VAITIRRAIAEAIAAKDGFYGYPHTDGIVSVEFRRGCAEIEVEYRLAGHEYPDTATIDAAPILTALLQQAIDDEGRA